MKLILASIALAASLSNAFAIDLPWEDNSRPQIMSKDFTHSFKQLPLSGRINDVQRLWANDYWPRKRGGINYRWNSKTPSGFELKSPLKEELVLLAPEDIAALAPSEKLDLLNGDYEYSIVKEVAANANPDSPIWHGICNGWAPASLNHDEPLPKTLVNPDGVQIPFGSSDIKALLSYYYAFKYDPVTTHQMGRRCKLGFGKNCNQDMNAGAFHIVLANKLGINGVSFIADIERGTAVWNHAITKYTSTIVNPFMEPARKSAEGTVKRVQILTEMEYVSKIKKNSWEPVLGTEGQINAVKKYEYTLDLDANDNIIGGEWISKQRPDFIWTMDRAQSFNGRFARLSELLAD